MTRQKSRKESVPKEKPLEKSLARYRELLDPREFDLLMEELEKPLVAGLRINPLKARGNEPKTWCDRYGWMNRARALLSKWLSFGIAYHESREYTRAPHGFFLSAGCGVHAPAGTIQF